MAGFILALFLKLELKYRGPWAIVKVIYKRCHSGRQGQAETSENGQQQNSNAEQGPQEASNVATAAKPPVRMCSCSAYVVWCVLDFIS